jgi:hypothetical protein
MLLPACTAHGPWLGPHHADNTGHDSSSRPLPLEPPSIWDAAPQRQSALTPAPSLYRSVQTCVLYGIILRRGRPTACGTPLAQAAQATCRPTLCRPLTAGHHGMVLLQLAVICTHQLHCWARAIASDLYAGALLLVAHLWQPCQRCAGCLQLMFMQVPYGWAPWHGTASA